MNIEWNQKKERMMIISKFSTKVVLSVLGILSCLISNNAFGKADDTYNQSFNVAPGGYFDLKTDLGEIEVISTTGESVEVDITFRRIRGSQKRFNEILEAFNVDMRHRGEDVAVSVEHNKNQLNFWNSVGKYLEVKFLISVPRKYNLELKTAGGSISVCDLVGGVRGSTSGGNLTFSRIKGAIVGRTSGGSIMLEACKGDVDVKTSGGKIHIGKVAGKIVAHTSGGSIDVDEVMGSIKAKTSGGSVTARISKQPEGDCVFSTSGGNITAYLEQDVGVDINAGTSVGRVKTDFPVNAVLKGKIDTRSLRGKINGGGPELHLHTSGGNININKL
jgi:DUF4097 and DUF4098 domain-containing protein YvlB